MIKPVRKIVAVFIIASATTFRLHPDAADRQDLFDAVIVKVVSDYLDFDVELFNIVLTPEYKTGYYWSGRVDVYKHGSVRISIDSIRRCILLIDESGSQVVFQSADQVQESGWTGSSWLNEFLIAP